MKIVQLTAENVKRLKAVSITPDGNVIVIGGRNAQGKSSVLDAITYALAGKRAVCDKPVREGAKKGEVHLDLGDLQVTTTFTPSGGGSVKVTGANGQQLASPQAILDQLTGTLTFDPLAFSRMDQKKQLETVRVLLGLDFTYCDAERKEAFDARTEVNRSVKFLSNILQEIKVYKDAPQEELSVEEVKTELAEAVKTQGEVERLKIELATKQQQIDANARRKQEIAEQIRTLQALSDQIAIDIIALCDQVSETRTKGSELFKAMVNPDTIREKLTTLETTNQQVRENARHAAESLKLKAEEQKAAALTKLIEDIDEHKRAAIAAAKFPVEGLSYDDDGLIYNGLPLSQASSAEQLRISVAIGIEMNPQLKVLLIRDGSLLDTDSLRLVAEMAEANDAQVWIERVGKGTEVSVVIEDGEVEVSE